MSRSQRSSWQKNRQKVKLFRGRSYAPCCFCRANLSFSSATIEHVVPQSAGGGWATENLRLSCYNCNQLRGTEDFEAFRTKIRTGAHIPQGDRR